MAPATAGIVKKSQRQLGIRPWFQLILKRSMFVATRRGHQRNQFAAAFASLTITFIAE